MSGKRSQAPVSPDNHLIGWNEIGSFLGATARSAQRWEKDFGLPVRRISGSRGGRVYAYAGELSDWLRRRGDPPHATISRPTWGRHWLAGAAVFAASSALGVSLGLPRPRIGFVTPVLPAQRQTIVIHGNGLGTQVAGVGIATRYLTIRDATAGWQTETSEAGRGVRLDIARWGEQEIDIAGFSGDFGAGRRQLRPGDTLVVSVWNPQDHIGPAQFTTRVQVHAIQPIVPFGN